MAVRRLAVSFKTDTGVTVLSRVLVPGRPLGLRLEQLVFRLAHQALVTAWRDGRCRAARIRIDSAPGDVCMTVVDDGLGPPQRWDGLSGRVRLDGLRRTVGRAGGGLEVGGGPCGGVTLTFRLQQDRHPKR